MTTETTPTPKTAGELTLAELLTLLRETVTEALAGIVGYPDESAEPSRDAGAAAEPEAVPNGFQRVGTGSRVQLVLDEAEKAAGDARSWSHPTMQARIDAIRALEPNGAPS